jgi:hypothetical protein
VPRMLRHSTRPIDRLLRDARQFNAWTWVQANLVRRRRDSAKQRSDRPEAHVMRDRDGYGDD